MDDRIMCAIGKLGLTLKPDEAEILLRELDPNRDPQIEKPASGMRITCEHYRESDPPQCLLVVGALSVLIPADIAATIRDALRKRLQRRAQRQRTPEGQPA